MLMSFSSPMTTLEILDRGTLWKGRYQYERFLDHVPNQPEDGCWLWTGHTHWGYGDHYFNGRRQKAHRISWQIFRGPIPDGVKVLHKCDTKGCVRPDHLFLGSQRDNIRDMFAKGRQHDRSGEHSGRAKLTEYAVKQIRLWYAEGGVTMQQLGAWYGVSLAAINAVIKRRNWQNT